MSRRFPLISNSGTTQSLKEMFISSRESELNARQSSQSFSDGHAYCVELLSYIMSAYLLCKIPQKKLYVIEV
jgi:hypothetical protein